MSEKDQFQMTKQDKTRLLIGGTIFFVIWALLSLAIPYLPSPWPPFYWALPVHGQVVDAETGAPLAGVIVVAEWELEGATPAGSLNLGHVAVMEAVTNREGHFTLWWGRPRLRWKLHGQLDSASPSLVFFKPGYTHEYCGNNIFRPRFPHPFPGSECSGQTTRLKKVAESAQKYKEQLSRLANSVRGMAFNSYDCAWKKMPRLLVAVAQELTRASSLTPSPSPSNTTSGDNPVIEYWDGLTVDRCGSLKKFLRSYLP